jgi:hypothetical protein
MKAFLYLIVIKHRSGGSTIGKTLIFRFKIAEIDGKSWVVGRSATGRKGEQSGTTFILLTALFCFFDHRLVRIVILI